MSMVQIQRGDTLSKLVAKYNRQHGTKLTVAQVAQANGLKDPNKIQAGRQLIFPDKFERDAKQQVIRNGQGDRMVRNGVNESVTVDATPRMSVEVQRMLDSVAETSGQPEMKQAMEADLAQVSGTTDAEIIASARPLLRVFYERLRADMPELADSLLGTMREVAQSKQQQVPVSSQELLRQQRLNILP